MRAASTVALVSLALAGCAEPGAVPQSTSPSPMAESAVTVVPVSEVQWEHLNPARGDQSPQAGTLWGDRNDEVPTGFLAKFVDGFSSPPHIHNITYRAVVISGLIHNDDPDAAPMWMRPGSFWTQPDGEVHITSAKGADTMALVEIDRGPYLVRPPQEAVDTGARPINVDASNIVWVDPPGVPVAANGPKLAYLWGDLQDGQSNGTFVRFPAELKGTIHSHATVRAVVITGQLQYYGTEIKTLEPGSYFGSQGETVHEISCGTEECVVYVRTDGRYDVRVNHSPQ